MSSDGVEEAEREDPHEFPDIDDIKVREDVVYAKVSYPRSNDGG